MAGGAIGSGCCKSSKEVDEESLSSGLTAGGDGEATAVGTEYELDASFWLLGASLVGWLVVLFVTFVSCTGTTSGELFAASIMPKRLKDFVGEDWVPNCT